MTLIRIMIALWQLRTAMWLSNQAAATLRELA